MGLPCLFSRVVILAILPFDSLRIPMLTSLIVRTVSYSFRHAWQVIILALFLCLGSAFYLVNHFAINTDVSRLIETNQPWAQRDRALDEAFPQRNAMTLIVVEAPAIELANQAAEELGMHLQQDQAHFSAVNFPEGGEFFARNGLLFLSVPELTDLTHQLGQAKSLLNTLAYDPSLRGLANTLSVTLLVPLQMGQVQLSSMAKLLGRSADVLEQTLQDRPAALSWRNLMLSSDAPADKPAHSLVMVRPVLDFGAIEAGQAAAQRIRTLADDLKLAQRYQATIRLTGATPLADEEFASVQEGAALNGALTFLAVLLILWLALRSGKMVFAVLLTMLIGLIITAAVGLWLVGALNMISIAFAVLFVGLGVDFGIQFGVRYREEHHADEDETTNLKRALSRTARAVAMPLSLAAAATSASFLAFLPTDYRGVSELGQIAGVGILFVAFPLCLTLLPAMIHVLSPSGGPAPPGFAWMAPVDHFFERYRHALLYGTLAVVLLAAPQLRHLHFDADPLHLKDPHAESMATLTALRGSSAIGMDDVNYLAPSLEAAQSTAKRLEQLPQVERTLTLASFIPDQQDIKLERIHTVADDLLPVLNQPSASAASDMARVAALTNAARQLRNAALSHPGPGAAEAQRLAAILRKLAAANAAHRDQAEQALALPLRLALSTLQQALTPQAISLRTLPDSLRQDWLTPDGRALVSISPRAGVGSAANASQQDRRLQDFANAVLQAEPAAIGGPISILASANTIIHAFMEAGAWALLSITLLLWLALRRFSDVLRTLLPLLVSAIVTLELCVLFGISLNFANIIALPLLLGVGVAFKIYYVMAWRNGQTHLLQTSLTQAIMLSAATTATAFGSLWLSHHPGTSSMGQLLALSLLCTLIGAVFFQPVLMGKPRSRHATTSNVTDDSPAPAEPTGSI